MSLPDLIGVTGYSRHGKDTVGQLLVEHGFTRASFADQVRELALLINPLVELSGTFTRLSVLVSGAGWEMTKSIPEVRRLLISLGTGVRKVVGEDAWIRALNRHLSDLSLRPIVVTDVRFKNEADWIKSLGGEVWRVIRLDADGNLYDGGVPHDDPSEREIPEIESDAWFTAFALEPLEARVRAKIESRSCG